MFKKFLFLCAGFAFLVFVDLNVNARSIMPGPQREIQDPEAQQRVHRVGDVYFCVTNWGFLGSQTRDLYESVGGCFSPNPDMEVPAPSFETPPNSGVEYLFQGALWIGAIVESESQVETLVTVGADGWWWIYEMAPGVGAEYGIVEKSTRTGVSCYSPDAISEQDVIALFSDTADAPLSPWDVSLDWDERPHHPLGVEVRQESYSWSEGGYDDFVIICYHIKNIGTHNLSGVYLGFYMDTDINHISEDPYNPEEGAQDDITGFLGNYVDPSGETTEVNIAWAADNDGQPECGVFTELSPTGVIGIKLLGCSNPEASISYNWWTSNGLGYPRDWGPWLEVNQQIWEEINPYSAGPQYRFPDNAMGTPGGDRSKYFLMSNGEFDFDQIFTQIVPDIDPSWVPASPDISGELVQGFDTRFLYTFGPFDLTPEDTIFVVLALVAGEDFHVDPKNRILNLPQDPYTYYSNLDFSDLVENCLLAQQIYDADLDLGPPAPIRHLKPGLIIDGSITLNWVATGDDFNMGKASFYDLRYSTLPVDSDTVSWWDMADTALDEPAPSEPGSIDSCQVLGLSPDSVYYFIIKACDNAGNWSGFSNIGYTGLPGDVDLDGEADINDILILIEYLLKSGTPPDVLAVADVNGDCMVNIIDIVYLIKYVFKAGVPPQTGCA